jgi:hypothetical protein
MVLVMEASAVRHHAHCAAASKSEVREVTVRTGQV